MESWAFWKNTTQSTEAPANVRSSKAITIIERECDVERGCSRGSNSSEPHGGMWSNWKHFQGIVGVTSGEKLVTAIKVNVLGCKKTPGISYNLEKIMRKIHNDPIEFMSSQQKVFRKFDI